ncbi:hypothetical protein PoB_000519700 [Plakobranchus ocellatus]|uniref:Uncharacterized protein n=1 Tax=Plakobranchus ocellatus TaxID=259542 RepID=A0AAV3Y7C6_9GAST|nr:hypothetical protein PoB_000519700 [Plakobranchus ocellatus]
MVKSDSYGSIKTMLSEIVMNHISIAAEDPSLSSTAASSCHDGEGASTDVSLIGSPIQSNRGRKRRRENAWKCNIAKARRNVAKKKGVEGACEGDMRGKHASRANKIDDEREHIRAHINSFPKTYSHYCRNNTKRRYLGSDLNLHTLYFLYKEKAETDGRKLASLSSYKNVFYKEFNLGFHKRLKDRCDYCVANDNMSEKEKLRKKGESEVHRNLKEQPRLYRDRCKEMVALSNDYRAAVFDLEDALATPKATEKIILFQRKSALIT